MGKAKKKAAPKESQSERFKRAAIEAGVDETGKTFERAFDRVIKKKTFSRPKRAKGRPRART